MDNNADNWLSMYLMFRKEIDTIQFHLLKSWSGNGVVEIKHGDNVVGFLMVIERYVNGIYVIPEFRRLGLAKKAVLNYIKQGGVIETLHIVNSNSTALAFWKSIFNLELIDECPCDTYYRVVSLSKC